MFDKKRNVKDNDGKRKWKDISKQLTTQVLWLTVPPENEQTRGGDMSSSRTMSTTAQVRHVGLRACWRWNRSGSGD